MTAAAARAGLELKLRALKLPAFVGHHGEVAGRAETEGWPFDRFLDALAELELEERTAALSSPARRTSFRVIATPTLAAVSSCASA